MLFFKTQNELHVFVKFVYCVNETEFVSLLCLINTLKSVENLYRRFEKLKLIAKLDMLDTFAL